MFYSAVGNVAGEQVESLQEQSPLGQLQGPEHPGFQDPTAIPCMLGNMWEDQRTTCDTWFPPSTMRVPRIDQTKVIKLGDKHLFQLSHPVSPQN